MDMMAEDNGEKKSAIWISSQCLFGTENIMCSMVSRKKIKQKKTATNPPSESEKKGEKNRGEHDQQWEYIPQHGCALLFGDP